MPCSPLTLAKRAFVKVLLALASSYSVAVQVNRATADHAVLTAYKRVALKVHPDKGAPQAARHGPSGSAEKKKASEQDGLQTQGPNCVQDQEGAKRCQSLREQVSGHLPRGCEQRRGSFRSVSMIDIDTGTS